jgi:hypothetical protein
MLLLIRSYFQTVLKTTFFGSYEHLFLAIDSRILSLSFLETTFYFNEIVLNFLSIYQAKKRDTRTDN